MAKQHLKVSQQWQRYFDAPGAIMRTSLASGHVLVVDEDAYLHLLDPAGVVVLSKQMPWMPSAAALDEDARKIALMSAAGTLLIMDRGGNTLGQIRLTWRPSSLDMSPAGDMVAFIDGQGKVGTVDLSTGKVHLRDERGPFCYIRLATGGTELFACGEYGQVMFVPAAKDDAIWQKDFHCHTRTPALSAEARIILIPSPHYGIIALRRDGGQIGLFDVPEGPKGVAVTLDGQRIFVVNEKNELTVFEADGKVFFRQTLGAGVAQFECGADGGTITALMTSGAVQRFSVGEVASDDTSYLELDSQSPAEPPGGPAVLWKAKVFSALGGARGGQVTMTRSARHTALLDIDSRLRVYDRAGTLTTEESRIPGRQPAIKASRTQDLIIAASSDMLLALDLRGYRQRRIALRNEWATHFDMAPNGIFFAVADFFRGVSLYDETLSRLEYIETDYDVLELAVDGRHHTMLALTGETVAVYDAHGAPLGRTSHPTSGITVVAGLGQGFAVASQGRLDAFTSDGAHAWTSEVPGEIISVTPTLTGLVVATADGNCYVTNAHGTAMDKMIRPATARFFGAADGSKGVTSVDYRGRLVTARSTETGVLWRREMDDEIVAMEISPDGGFVTVLAGIYLYALSTATGEETPEERLYLEI